MNKLRQQVGHDVAVDVGEAEVEALVTVEAGVVDAKKMQNGGVQTIWM